MNQRTAKMLRRFTALKEHSLSAYRSMKRMWNAMPESRRQIIRLMIQRSTCASDPQELMAAMKCMKRATANARSFPLSDFFKTRLFRGRFILGGGIHEREHAETNWQNRHQPARPGPITEAACLDSQKRYQRYCLQGLRQFNPWRSIREVWKRKRVQRFLRLGQ